MHFAHHHGNGLVQCFVVPVAFSNKYEHRVNRRFGSTHLCAAGIAIAADTRQLGPFENVRTVGCGTWQWGNRFLFGYNSSQDEHLQEAFNAALDASPHRVLFDTGDSYGTGLLKARAEVLLGKFTQEHKDGDRALIATKVATYPWRFTARSIADAVASSANRLSRRVDIAQIHWSAQNYAPWQEKALWDGIADSVDRGDASSVGVSNYGPEQLRKVHRYLLEERGIQLASVQVQLSLLSRDPISPNGVIAVANELGIDVIGYSPLCLGLLTGKYRLPDRLPSQGSRRVLFSRILRGAETLLSELQAVATECNATCAQVAIAWCLSKGVFVLSGIRNKMQANELLLSKVLLAQDQCRRLEIAASQSSPQMVQNIFQTK